MSQHLEEQRRRMVDAAAGVQSTAEDELARREAEAWARTEANLEAWRLATAEGMSQERYEQDRLAEQIRAQQMEREQLAEQERELARQRELATAVAEPSVDEQEEDEPAPVAEPVPVVLPDEWRPHRLVGQSATASGVATVALGPVPLGWEWKVGRISVTLAAASGSTGSGGASVTVYVASGSSGIDRSGAQMVDFTDGLSVATLTDGTVISRQVADEQTPIHMVGGDLLLVDVTGADSAVNSTVYARMEATRRGGAG